MRDVSFATLANMESQRRLYYWLHGAYLMKDDKSFSGLHHDWDRHPASELPALWRSALHDHGSCTCATAHQSCILRRHRRRSSTPVVDTRSGGDADVDVVGRHCLHTGLWHLTRPRCSKGRVSSGGPRQPRTSYPGHSVVGMPRRRQTLGRSIHCSAVGGRGRVLP